MSDADTGGFSEESTDITSTTGLPESDSFSREYVESLRKEAAQARVAKKNAVAAAKEQAAQEANSKIDALNEQVVRLKSEGDAARFEVKKYQAVLDAGVPSEKVQALVGLIKGSTDDELTASVAALLSVMEVPSASPDRAVDPLQGRGGVVPLNGDPILSMLKSALKM